MSVGRKLQFPKRTSSSSGVPYRLSVFGNPSYLCIFSNNSRFLSNWPGNVVFCSNGCVERSVWCRRGGRSGAVCVIILIVCSDLVGQHPLPVLGSSPSPIQLGFSFFCNFLQTVCIIGRDKVADMGSHESIQSCCGHWAFQKDLSWLLGIGWYRLGYRWVIPQICQTLYCRNQLKIC